ncbi:DUF5011 domain-containing protein [Pontibacter sp. BT310]|uniref:DUF5011 domain-containing protein n=1 Tax=Pontibacter populi TaxID=890055 RepID=A0ABS6X756_9BACT|nr:MULTISPECIES: DUF5011 domain-containing protein [Pontibacter]MBJ6116982.1 DUF5011 domain-containing protein [Pontibacter sp. BT310]MBR0569406.1 DUF5011 domain-containing protein [Microvirga sp. STS03]MBW3363835.1 DUF5011 domain-containing protein [Pontibacter populi]
MKRNKILYFFALFAACLFVSCDKDTEDISTITFYPVFEMEGEQFQTVFVGDTYTDSAVTATEAGEPSEITTVGSVDTSTPGVYTITYSATNKDGFTVSVSRYIGVIDSAVTDVDLSGMYQRTAGALGVSTVIKLGPGHYTTDNVGGVAVPGPSTTIHFFNTEGTTLVAPAQEVAGGGVFSIEDGSYVPVGNSASQYSWVVINPGYGTALRTFERL